MVIAECAGKDISIGSCPATEIIVARTADQGIVAGAALQAVIAVVAVQQVVAAGALKQIASCAAVQRIVADIADHTVVQGVAGHIGAILIKCREILNIVRQGIAGGTGKHDLIVALVRHLYYHVAAAVHMIIVVSVAAHKGGVAPPAH